MEKETNRFLGGAPVGKPMGKYAVPCVISLLAGALSKARRYESAGAVPKTGPRAFFISCPIDMQATMYYA